MESDPDNLTGAIAIMPRIPIPYSPSGIAPGHWTPNGLCIRNPRGRSTIDQARSIASTLGPYRAARYLRKRGWSIDAALHILTTPRSGSRP